MAARRPPDTVYFESPAAFRRWLAANHGTASELVVGFHKAHTGKPSLTWPESVDEALCFGWIDGVRHRVDEDRYTIRFTPRQRNSLWSFVNVRRVKALTEAGRMQPAGLAAFDARRAERGGAYSFEQPPTELSPAEVRAFKANKPAWRFFEEQPPGYRKTVVFWVTSAKKPETRTRRLDTLIADSAAGVRVGILGRR